jgi:hypothetical protein
VPSDVEFRRNFVYTPASWKGVWTKKNLFETKNVRRILVEGNIFENSWAQAQTGNAILLKSSGDNCPQAVLEDMTFRYNIIRNAPKGLAIVGTQENWYPHSWVALTNKRILVSHNIFDNVGDPSGPATSRWIFGIYVGGEDIILDHNTIASGQTDALMVFSSQTTGSGFRFTNNIADLGGSGVIGDGSLPVPGPAVGTNPLDAYYPGSVFQGNVLGLGEWGIAQFGETQLESWYPSGNYFARTRDALGLLNYALPTGSPFSGVATDGANPGADVATVLNRTAGVK